jgi:hypothetical protein
MVSTHFRQARVLGRAHGLQPGGHAHSVAVVQPAVRMVQPATGFQVASVRSIVVPATGFSAAGAFEALEMKAYVESLALNRAHYTPSA